jgi:hypothetical protein
VGVAEISEQLLIADIERRLTSKYARISPHQISTTVQNARARFDHSRIRDFVPLLVERHARAELAKLTAPVTAPVETNGTPPDREMAGGRARSLLGRLGF